MADFHNEINENPDTGIINDLDEPASYRVLLHNDNFSTMEFVVEVLETVFHKTASEAAQIMLNVHKKGIGECGIFPFSIAETKVSIVASMAKKQECPLLCTMEEV